jgi:hypothetical protein
MSATTRAGLATRRCKSPDICSTSGIHADQPAGSGASFAEPRDHMSPAFPRSMHICFHLHDEVDFNDFIRDLEAEAARRGMTQVKANRVVTVATEQERLAAPHESLSNRITEGRSNGWTLIYCKNSSSSCRRSDR